MVCAETCEISCDAKELNYVRVSSDPSNNIGLNPHRVQNVPGTQALETFLEIIYCAK